MSKLNTYTIKGTKQKTSVSLPKEITEEVNLKLLAQAVRVYEDRRHPGLSQVKTRSQIVASKRKIYRQKGTGRARHGALSAPIFVGGGKAHGPTGLKRELKMPKKMRNKALKMAFTQKANEGKLIVVDGVSKINKTKEAGKLVKTICEKEDVKFGSGILFALSDKNRDAVLYLRNLENVNTTPFSNLNPYNVFHSRVLIVDKDALQKTNPKKKSSTKKKITETKSKKS